MTAINFCDILNKHSLSLKILFEKLISYEPKINRIYVGSYFCSQYFLSINFWDELIRECEKDDIYITMCLPIFSEKDNEIAKSKISDILERSDIIDEVTVNDFGMLKYIAESFKNKINLGRLFFKDPRDVRIKSLYSSCTTPALLTFDLRAWKISGIELDMMSQEINIPSDYINSAVVCLHKPYCFLTTGNICKYGSIHQSIDHKFRPNGRCQIECSKVYEKYFEDVNGRKVDIIRFGRGVYYKNLDSHIFGRQIDRVIYFPIDEVINSYVCGETK